MQYLCLIFWDEAQLDAVPQPEMDTFNAEHLDFNDALRAQGKLVTADALAGSSRAKHVTLRSGTKAVTDGPYTETKEMVAGYYLLDAKDIDEAVDIAAGIPSARHAVIEVREIRKLIVGDRTS